MSSVSLKLENYNYNNINNKSEKTIDKKHYNQDMTIFMFNSYKLSHKDMNIFNSLYSYYCKETNNSELTNDIINKINNHAKFIDIIIYMYSKYKNNINFIFKSRIEKYIKSYLYNKYNNNLKSSDKLLKEQTFKTYRLDNQNDFNSFGKNTILKQNKTNIKSNKYVFNNYQNNSNMFVSFLFNNNKSSLETNKKEENINNIVIKLNNNEDISVNNKVATQITDQFITNIDDKYTEIKL